MFTSKLKEEIIEFARKQCIKYEQSDIFIRFEVEQMLNNVGITMSDKQIDDVIGELEHDTFQSIIGLFIAKGIETVAERENIPFNEEEIQHQLDVNRSGINFSEL